ncbi:hypothetical protein RCL1_005259 [Eukaryota sp. TZLM3-RCL]
MTHPIVQHHSTLLRDSSTTPEQFRVSCRIVTTVLGIEALGNLALRSSTIATPVVTECKSSVLSDQVVFVPILRAGLSMLEPMTSLVPNASFGFIGMVRDEVTKLPTQYLSNLPAVRNQKWYCLEPMLATGGSSSAALEALVNFGVLESNITLISIFAAPEGIQTVKEKFPAIRLVIGNEDEGLTVNKYIIPGCGDFGDRWTLSLL